MHKNHAHKNNNSMENNGSWKLRVEESLSKQFNLEMTAFYFYTACYQYCKRRAVACNNIAIFFKKQMDEESEHAVGIIDFMNDLKFDVEYKTISTDSLKACTLIEVFERAYALEYECYQNILALYKEAEKNDDFSLTQFLDPYVSEQVKSVKEFSDYLTNSKRCNEGLGIFLFDQSFKCEK